MERRRGAAGRGVLEIEVAFRVGNSTGLKAVLRSMRVALLTLDEVLECRNEFRRLRNLSLSRGPHRANGVVIRKDELDKTMDKQLDEWKI